MAAVPQFYYRTSKTIGLTDAVPKYSDVPGFVKPAGNLRTCVYSHSGGNFAYATVENVQIVNSYTGEVVQMLPIPNVYDLSFSPKGSYLCTFERPVKVEEGQTVHHNFNIWNVATGEKTMSFIQKAQTMANFQFTHDEKFAARLVQNELLFYDTSKFGLSPSHRLQLEGISSFAISSGNSYYVAVFVPEKGGKPAIVDVYSAPNFGRPLSSKSLFKAERVVFLWNNLGTSLIVWTQTEVDQTGKNYYGESNLYLRGIAGNYDSRIALNKEGPIHDVVWSPDSKEFAVVYGYMPAKTMIFNHRGESIRSLPLGPRNTVLYSPHGRYVILAGFGNLQGEVDIYDRQNDYKKVCTIDASNTSVCEWSPDGRYILFATTSPRLRVDNGVKIFHISGKLVYVREMNELFSVSWRPESPDSYPLRSLSPPPEVHESAQSVELKAPVKKAGGAYRPPHARGSATPLHFKREDEGGFAISAVDEAKQRTRARRAIPGAEAPAEEENADAFLSKAALKNKKKREAKKAREAEAAVEAPSVTPGSAANGQDNGSPTPPGLGFVKDGIKFKNPQDEKKYRGLLKKLRAIEDLKARQSKGEKLEDTQETKIKTEATVKGELAALGWTE
ncbi:eukaryotic translation initiation factor eIF2A-domain-containing protein [Limtongia smithiae]|uniref:eukaryotic translation initiation factor eIF2A-domain-containing protein n=1 Tax=Limtongia smithiae TaxID=1125753 RepID=UPI0034CDB9B1